jgi:predicted dithiol-disulfide oxidoreductase (DUF899 family)
MTMDMPQIVSPQEWTAEREKLLAEEKELTHARDALAAKRRRMPRMAVEKDYTFDGPNGAASLLDLFDGRRQLIVYRFFFEPGVASWPEGGCPGCSFLAGREPAAPAVAPQLLISPAGRCGGRSSPSGRPRRGTCSSRGC